MLCATVAFLTFTVLLFRGLWDPTSISFQCPLNCNPLGSWIRPFVFPSGCWSLTDTVKRWQLTEAPKHHRPCPQWTLLNGSAFIFGQCLFNRHQYRGSTAVMCTRKPKYSRNRHLEPHRDSFILWGLALEWKAVLPGEVDEVMSLTEAAGGRGRGGDRWCSSTARPHSLSLHVGWSRHQYIIPQNSSGLCRPHLDASQYKLFSGVLCLMGRMRARSFSHAPVPVMSAWEQNFKISELCVQISEMQQFINAFPPPLMENGLAEAGGKWRSVCCKGDFLIFFPAINIHLKGPDVLSAYTERDFIPH